MEGTNNIVEIPIENSHNLSSKKRQISSENTITLKFVTLKMNKVSEKINSAEYNNQKTNQDIIRCYHNFGKGYNLWYDFYRQSHNEDTSNALVDDKIREHILDQDKLQSISSIKIKLQRLIFEKEKAKKIFTF
ncbi:36768_t:CDS:2 [Racocetra persica]|uniref:36768_t:CDS:1 n=1 Tax=Racocetra persica TaxID=160502 RepID=A0ACA9LD79_9GLOM|nr:36768_t:CDS:2 [Racocetra persica]